MVDERRGAHRVHMSGVRVTYESAAGESVEADILDLGAGGVFIRTAMPLPVGKRISLELQVIGESAPWAALGRVVWIREKGEGDKAPPGMAVKFIDADDAVIAGIERLVETRERTEPGVGKSKPPPAVAPVVIVAPEREKTLLGVGLSPEEPPLQSPPSREQSVAIDLIPKKPAAKPAAKAPLAAEAPLSVPPVAPPPKPVVSERPGPPSSSGGGGRLVVILLLLVVAGVAAYVLLDGFLRPPGH
ncbi:MAG TPA: PilZ domain-containing protein [Polyangiaceae bacterium]